MRGFKDIKFSDYEQSTGKLLVGQPDQARSRKTMTDEDSPGQTWTIPVDRPEQTISVSISISGI